MYVTKEEIKLFLFSGDMSFYIENPRASIVKLLELTREFSRLTGYQWKLTNCIPYSPGTNSDKIQKYKKKHHLQSMAKMVPNNKRCVEVYDKNYKMLTNKI